MQSSSAQLRIVNYNTAKRSSAELEIVFQAMRDEVVNGYSRIPDIFVLQEQTDSSLFNIINLLDSAYGIILYEPQASALPGSSGSDVALLYRADTIKVLEEVSLTTDGPRPTMRYKLRPIGYDARADFYIYGSHLRASPGSFQESVRAAEVATIRADADALGPDTKIIYTGDLNFYDSYEAAYVNYTTVGNGQAFDPVAQPGNWHDNGMFKLVHTQSPVKIQDGGLIGGGIDDRFDFQLLSSNLMDAEGVSYVDGTYRVFGNDGSHIFNEAIDTGSWAPPGVSNPSNVLAALMSSADHLPVILDYRLPAKLAVSVNSTPVIKGAAASNAVSILVANEAASGADELDHAGSGSGYISGSFVGVEAAGAGGGLYTLNADTSMPGEYTGTVTTVASSPETMNPTNVQQVAYTVLDHSEASFQSGGDQNDLTLDFGAILQYSGIVTIDFSIYNIVQTVSYSADLNLVGYGVTGDSDILTHSIEFPYVGIKAGEEAVFQARFNTADVGEFSAVYTFSVADEDYAGGIFGDDLRLTLNGAVAAVGEILSVLPAEISEAIGLGQTLEVDVTLSNSAPTSHNWTLAESAGWLSASSSSGTIPGNGEALITFTLDAGALAAGQYTTTVSIDSPTAQTVNLPMQMFVTGQNEIIVDPVAFDLELIAGQSTNVGLNLANVGNLNIDVSLSHDALVPENWLAVTPAAVPLNAQEDKNVSVMIDSANMLVDVYSATITVSEVSGEYDAVEIPVNLTVTEPPAAEIDVSPSGIDVFAESGQRAIVTVTVANVAPAGSEQLVFTYLDDAVLPVDWIFPSLTGGLIDGGQAAIISLTLDAENLTPDVYTATISITSDDNDEEVTYIPVRFEVLTSSASTLVMQPRLLEKHVVVGQPVTDPCAVDLYFAGETFYEWMIQHQPYDNGGKYNIVTSEEPDGPVYVWDDIAGIGNQLLFSNVSSRALGLGFDFPFYGTDYDTFYVNEAGFISVVDVGEVVSSIPVIPGPVNDNDSVGLIGLSMGDYDIQSSGTVYYYKPDSSTMIVQYDNVRHNNGTNELSAQVVLKADGSILCYIENDLSSSALDRPIIGIQRNSIEGGLVSSRFLPAIEQDFAVKYTPENTWLSYTMPASDHRNSGVGWTPFTCLEFAFDPVGLEPGTYFERLHFYYGNVATNQTNYRAYTVVMHVHATEYDAWAAQYFEGDEIEGGVAARENDADEDGLTNEQEFFLGTSPVYPVNGYPMFNEVRSNDDGADDAEFVELIAPAGFDLTGYTITHFNGAEDYDGGLWKFTFPFFTVPDDDVLSHDGTPLGFAVISRSSVLNTDFDMPGALQNGPDALILRDKFGNVKDSLTWGGVGDFLGDDPGITYSNLPVHDHYYSHALIADDGEDNSLQAPHNVKNDNGSGWSISAATPGAMNQGQADGAIVILAEVDTDGDGFYDWHDNCPDDDNPSQIDTDEDGIGDACDDDIDGDGMPNDWETRHGLNILVDDANDDPDVDGVFNINEYYADTDPNDLDSLLYIRSIEYNQVAEMVELEFTSSSNREYIVEYNDISNFRAGIWDSNSATIPGLAGETTHQDNSLKSNCIYRIRAIVP